ncbi:hypothetical protein ACFX2I_037592 [Malus domestica]
MCRTLDAYNSYVGTCVYMSPKRFDPDMYGDNYDGYASDIWSLGLTLMKLYIGHFPFLTSRSETRLGHPHQDWGLVHLTKSLVRSNDDDDDDDHNRLSNQQASREASGLVPTLKNGQFLGAQEELTTQGSKPWIQIW